MSLDENKDTEKIETAASGNNMEPEETVASIQADADGDASNEAGAASPGEGKPAEENSDSTFVTIEAVPDGEEAGVDSAEANVSQGGRAAFKPGEAIPTVLINYHSAGPMQRCYTSGFDLKINMKVIAERSGGLSLATIKSLPEMYTPTAEEQLPRVVRFIDDRDHLIIDENKRRSAEARRICNNLVEKLNLDMKLIDVEYLHSLNKAIFYFSAEGRIDFRELIRELARSLHIRVEMCQIGVRDEAKLIGGLGPCGLPTCCSTFLGNFAPVSIKMAKEQNLTLNPEKVSGLCGRLICCLSYESQVYRDVQEGLPKIGKKADTWKGRGRVAEIDVFRNKISFDIEEEEERFICSIDEYREYMQNRESFIPWDERDEEGRQKKKTSPGMKAADASRNTRRERGTRPGIVAAAAARNDRSTVESASGDVNRSSEVRDGAVPENGEAVPLQPENVRRSGPDRPERRGDNFRRRNDSGERPRETRRDDRPGRPEREKNDRSERPEGPGRPEQGHNQRNGGERQNENRPQRPPRPPRNHERASGERPTGAPGAPAQPQQGGRPSDAIRQRPLEPSKPRNNGENGGSSPDGGGNHRNRHNRYNRPRNGRPENGETNNGGNSTPVGGSKPGSGSEGGQQ